MAAPTLAMLWDPNYTDEERRAERLEVGLPSLEMMTDEGNATIYARLMHPWLRCDRSRDSQTSRCWLVWSGTHWQPDMTGAHLDLAREVALVWDAYAVDLERRWAKKSKAQRRKETSDESGKARQPAHAVVRAWASKCRALSRLRALVELASVMPQLRATAADFDGVDCDWWVATSSGEVVDVRTGQAEPARPHVRMGTRCAPAAWRPDLQWRGTLWDRHLELVTCGDDELAAWLQRLFGAALFGTQREHVFALHYGPLAGNGKSTTMGAIAAALGDGYCRQMAESTLIESSHGRDSSGPSPDLIDFAGVRLMWTDEIPDGAKLDMTRVKQLTGGMGVRTRGLFRSQETVRPTWLLMASTNGTPRLGGDRGIGRRIRVVPWHAQLADHPDADPDIGAKLEAERDVVFAWLVEGARIAYEEGIGTCPAVEEATRSMLQNQDPMAMWMDPAAENVALCTDGDARSYWCEISKFTEAYVEWYTAQNFGKAEPKQHLITRQLASYGVVRAYATVRQDTGGTARRYVYVGVRLVGQGPIEPLPGDKWANVPGLRRHAG